MIFAEWDAATTALSTFAGTVAAFVGLWLTLKALRNKQDADDRRKANEREQALIESGRQEERDKFAKAKQRIEQRKLKIGLAAVQRIVSGVTESQTTELKQNQKSELGHLTGQIKAVDAKVDKLHDDFIEHKRESDLAHQKADERFKNIENGG
jgi:hypothetical protein